MEESPPKWNFLDHPADLRIEVWGKSLENLFLNAALALTHLLVGSSRHSVSNVEKNLILESGSLDILLVDWLREILFYFSGERFVLCDAIVKIEEPNLLKASLSGFVLQPSHESDGGMEIKGVTYHGLSLEENPEGFVARVVFDI